MASSCSILGCERSGAVVELALSAAIDGENSVVIVTGGIIDDLGGVPTISGVRERANLIVFVSEVDGFNVAIVTGDTIDGVGGVPKAPDNRERSVVVMALVLKTGGLDTAPLITDCN